MSGIAPQRVEPEHKGNEQRGAEEPAHTIGGIWMDNGLTKVNGNPDILEWRGDHAFLVTGTVQREDTLRIVIDRKDEKIPSELTLVLPTLCITLAQMKFTNDIGGVQEDFPESADYGLRYFDPPLEIDGKGEIEKFTWIRLFIGSGREVRRLSIRMGS